MYQYLRSPGEVEKIVPSLLDETLLAFDTETTGLDPHTDKVILASVSTPTKTYLINTQDNRCLKALGPVLEKEEVRKIGHNLQFDYSLTKGTVGVDLEGGIDTYLAEKLLGAGVQWDGFSLEAVTRKYLNKERDKSLQKSFIGHKGEFSKEQLQYAAEDTSTLIPLYETMKAKMDKEGMGRVWEIENRALPAFADMYFYGLKIDVPAWHQIMDNYSLKLKEAESHLTSFFEPYFSRDLFGALDINLASQPTILYGLQRMGVKVDGVMIRDTNDATRRKIAEIPVIKALDNLREAQKALGTYGQPYLDAIHPVTGRIHPKIDQLGTDTGRSTCPKPNVSNIPREEFFRHAFITDIGRLISTVDWSGAELRILAERSGDPLMIKGFNAGVDFHTYVASLMFRQKVEKNSPLRSPAKQINFMLAYGGGAGKLFATLNGLGYKTTLEECKSLMARYKDIFKVAIKYLDANKRKAIKELEMSNLVGRKRRWTAPNFEKAKAVLKAEFLKKRKKSELDITDECQINRLATDKVNSQRGAIEREGANFDIQSTNVEFLKDAVYVMRKEFKKRRYDARFYNLVYDETVLDVAEKDAEAVHDLQKKIMNAEGQKYCKSVPIEVEGKLKPYWTK